MAWVLNHRLRSMVLTSTLTSHTTTILNDSLSWMGQVGRYPSWLRLLRRRSHGPLSFTVRTGRPLRRVHGNIEGQAREYNVRMSRYLKILGTVGYWGRIRRWAPGHRLEKRFAVLCGAWVGGGDALWFIILDRKYSCYPHLKF